MSEDDIDIKWNGLLWGVKRSVRYNEKRRRFFETCQRLSSATSVLFGSAAIVTVLKWNGNTETIIAAAIVTVVSTFDLVIGFGRQAWLHADIARRFITLQQDMLFSETTAENLKKFERERLDIEKDEPPVRQVLDLLCHNELLIAEDYERDQLYKIGFIRRLFSQVIDIDPQSIITFELHKKSRG